MVGTGGIGSGQLLPADGQPHAGARGEPRRALPGPAGLLQAAHHLPLRAGRCSGTGFPVLPIGQVGDDEAGQPAAAREMAGGRAGPALRARAAGAPTPCSRSASSTPTARGGNLTTDDSACAAVDPAAVAGRRRRLRRAGGAGASPWPRRRCRWRPACACWSWRASTASCAPPASPWGRCPRSRETGLLGQVDLLGVNLEEALAAAGLARPLPRRALRARRAGRRRGRRARRRAPRAAALGHGRGRRQLELGRRRAAALPRPARARGVHRRRGGRPLRRHPGRAGRRPALA